MINNVLVTGGAGYIGSHVVEILAKKNKNIFIVDNLSTGYKKLINKKAKFFKCNILDTRKLREIIAKNNIDSIIHLAANLIIGEGERRCLPFNAVYRIMTKDENFLAGNLSGVQNPTFYTEKKPNE